MFQILHVTFCSFLSIVWTNTFAYPFWNFVHITKNLHIFFFSKLIWYMFKYGRECPFYLNTKQLSAFDSL